MMRGMKRVLPLVLCLLAPTFATAQESLDDVLEPIRQKHNLPALGGAIVTTDGVVAVGAVGVRQQGHAAKVTHDDLWHLGSCTKSMTATLIGIYVERGVIDWDTTVAEVFPHLAPYMHEQFRGATVAELLSHRAGIPTKMSRPQRRVLGDKNRSLHTRRWNLTALVTALKPKAEPGTRYEYSNQGYMIAGAMLEERTGKTWEELMRTELFEPLGMSKVGFGPPGSRHRIDQPRGHRDRKNGHRRAYYGDNTPGLGPAGTVHASLGDWGKYIAFHLRGPQETGRLRLKAETFKVLRTPAKGFRYALGWSIKRRGWGGGTVISHNGSNTMNYCVTWVAPKRGFAVLATTNFAGTPAAGRGCDAVASALIQRHLKGPKPKTKPRQSW